MSIAKLYRRDNQPFAIIPNEAIRSPHLTQGGFRLLAYLMSHQDGYDITYDQIERETGLGRYAINQAATNLVNQGWLEVSRPKLSNGQYGAKSWTILNPTTVGNSTMESPHLGKSTDIKKNTLKEEQVKEEIYAQNEFEHDFDEFWNTYPRKVGKGAAKKAFRRAVKDANVATVLAGVVRLANDPYLPPKQFIPHPATWLNKQGWEDEPYPERVLTVEEKQAQAQVLVEKRRLADAEHSKRLKAEMQAAQAAYEANPPEPCQHRAVKLLCKICN